MKLQEESNEVLEVLTIEKLEEIQPINEINSFCDICNDPITSFKEAQDHFKSIHNQVAYLICCNRKFKQQSIFLNHLKLHTNPNLFQCSICYKNLTSKAILQSHVLLHSDAPIDEVTCDLCGKKKKNKYRLASHFKEFHMENFECEKCKKKFSTEIRLKRHKKNHKMENFKCEICQKILKSSSSLKDHLKSVHSQTDKVECSLCGHFLKNQISMRKHLNRHRQMEQNIKCEMCQKPCTTRAALRSHMRMKHLLKKIIPCKFCDKKFKTELDKNEHEATHTGIDLYKCEFCGAGFKFGANYRAHRKKDHPEEYEKIKPRWLKAK